MQYTRPTARWFFWELGLLCSLWAIATAPVGEPEFAAYGVVALLFMWGLIRN